MDEVNRFREGRICKKDGDIEFDILTVDDIGLPPYPIATQSGGYPKRINEIINMDTRPDDIILATFPKSGTHWMAEILDMLARGNAEYSMERKVLPLELIADLTSFNSLPSPRVLQTHLPYKWFPRIHVENKGKIIHCIRNPKDMYVSMFHHCSTGLELGRKTEGMTRTQFFDNCIMEKVCLHGTWFDYVKQMDQAKKDGQNIYTVHYEKMKENLYQGIKAIARFLELHYSDDLLKDIIQKCSFSNLKRAYDDIKELPSEVQTSNKHYVEMFPDYQLPNIFRKGIVGDWKNHFTVAQNEQFDALYEKGMKDCDIEVL